LNTIITYRTLFIGFLCSILTVFFFTRQLNSPWHRFIGGDGLGYYAYLPAKYIYHDEHYAFKWFNEVYALEYLSSGSESADEHFLVSYQNKKVNKYYPGLSFLWLPFFALAHVCALVFQFPANGFSLPYQWAIGFASMFYLFLGLVYLRKLIFRFTSKAWIALFVPVVIFYGTHLFDYAINMNSLSHVYSFSIITIFSYFAFRFFNEEENKLYHLCLLIFLCALVVSIRPMNVLILGLLPALSLKHWEHPLSSYGKPKGVHFAILAATAWILIRQFFILKISTGHLLPNTYQSEPFHFFNPELLRATFGFQYGVFLYAPLLLFSFSGAYFYPGKIKPLILPLLFFVVLYIYASWWFWPICTRASIDYYVIPALLLGALAKRFQSIKARLLFALLCGLFCCYYQVKLMQINRGILDKNYTYAHVYFENFFKVEAVQQFVVPPYTIKNRFSISNSFEDKGYTGPKSDSIALNGKYSAYLDVNTEYSPEFRAKIPEFCFGEGLAKVRYTANVMALAAMREFQVYINFSDEDGKQTLSIPFYVKEDQLRKENWLKMEFGHEFNRQELEHIRNSTVQVFIWNSSKKNRLYIDDVKLEFFLCDRSAEIVP
jgi:hypothetical protein